MDSSTTSPGVTATIPVRETTAARTRQHTPSSCIATHETDATRPLSRSRRSAARRTSSAPSATRETAVRSRPWARVTGMSEAISPTRDENPSISRRNSSLRTRERRDIVRRISSAVGMARAYTGRNSGTLRAVIVTAPSITMVADSSGCVTCCSISSTFSTSRTTLLCTTAELARVW